MKNKGSTVFFLSGPMSGIPDAGREEFNRVERILRSNGCLVLNPACLPLDLPGKCYMPICLAMLRESDTVMMLNGWENSAGAIIEREYAMKCGKGVLEWSEYEKLVREGNDDA